MADITVRNQGQVDDSGKVNWRGDQVSLTPGGQSIYDTSTVKLADLGSRKVVGDRVFRYALANGGAGAGDVCESVPASLLAATAGTVSPAGGKTFVFYGATAVVKGVYDEGYLHCGSGTAANLGYMYRVKHQPVCSSAGNMTLELYDPLKIAVDVVDEWSLHANIYGGVVENTDGTELCVGVAPVLVASGEYFWLQTWGPCAVKGSATANAGIALTPGATGEVYDYAIGTDVSTTVPIGQSIQVLAASGYGMAFLTIAP